MYRYERPQSGRDRELTQFGMEILGSDDPLSDAEIISAAVNVYKMLGLKEIKVNLNTLGDTESRNNYRKALLDYFKPYLDDLCDDCKERYAKNPLRILDCKEENCIEILKNAPVITDFLYSSSSFICSSISAYNESISEHLLSRYDAICSCSPSGGTEKATFNKSDTFKLLRTPSSPKALKISRYHIIKKYFSA